MDAAIITSPENRQYISGFHIHEGMILVTRKEVYYLVDFRYYEAAEKKSQTCKVVLFDSLAESISDILKSQNIRGVSVEKSSLTVQCKEYLENIITSAGSNLVCDGTIDIILRDMRMVKSEKEIAKIKASQELTESAFKNVLKNLKTGQTEKDIALDLEFYMRKNGAESVAFDLIVVSGMNTSLPHGEPGNKQIENGDLITIDIGAKLDGYNSDMTRTISIGSIGDRQKEIYNIVLKSQIAGIEAIRPGAICSEVDGIVRDIITDAGYGEQFKHSTGHGVGLQIHESPNLSPNSLIALKPGMIVTVEPGIYLKNEFGVRIEDMILVKEKGYENLTNIPKDILII
jgi:Xaa-Pro aminopeptidase